MKKIHTAYCDPYDLAIGNQPTLFNRKFWLAGCERAIAVKVVCSDADAKRVKEIRAMLAARNSTAADAAKE